MAGRAAGVFMRAFKREVCFLVVIKCRLSPTGCGVTVAAFFTMFAVMNISFLVTVITAMWRFVVFFFRLVACFATRFGVHAFEQEICPGMVECGRVE